MPRIRLTVAYVGTNYQGWQVQGRGATIQGAIDACPVSCISWE